MFYEFKGYRPVLHKSSFVHPQACVIGNVTIGKNVYVGPGAVLRGDFGEIIIGNGCNVQENCIIHMFPGVTVLLKENAHIGHGAILHGCTIGKNVLIGMNAVLMDNVEVGDNSIIGALSLLPEGMKVPAGKVVMGNPAKITKDVTGKMLKWKTRGTAIYKKLPKDFFDTHTPCSPLHSRPPRQKKQKTYFKTWKETQAAE